VADDDLAQQLPVSGASGSVLSCGWSVLRLVAMGASIDVIPGYSEQTALHAAGATGTRRQILVDWLKERGAGQG
jgi:hypothetical protein